jgi:hypothetical protein
MQMPSGHPNPHQAQHPSQHQHPHGQVPQTAQATSQLVNRGDGAPPAAPQSKREKRILKIVDPSTGKTEVFIAAEISFIVGTFSGSGSVNCVITF